MPTLKRSASASPELVGRPSSFHTSVTLYEATPVQASSGEAASGLLPRRSKRVKVKEENDINEIFGGPSSSRKSVKKTRTLVEVKESDVDIQKPARKAAREASPRKPKAIQQSLDVPHPAPPHWKEVYETIKRMRENIVAPVDTMGCDQAQLKETDPKSQRFSTLISLMLSSQTKDEVTDAAVSKLREAIGGSLTVNAILQSDESTISEAIAKVGFWRRKTQYIKQTAQRLHDEFDSDIPKTVDELCSLPGVGPKMAFLALQVAWNINVGIGVDVHVHRITNRLGWHKPPTKNPEETRLNLQSWLPHELRPKINHMLVGFGQMICLPVKPRCDSCDLSNGLCPSAAKVTRKESKRVASVTKRSPSKVGDPEINIAFEEEDTKESLTIGPLDDTSKYDTERPPS